MITSLEKTLEKKGNSWFVMSNTFVYLLEFRRQFLSKLRYRYLAQYFEHSTIIKQSSLIFHYFDSLWITYTRPFNMHC